MSTLPKSRTYIAWIQLETEWQEDNESQHKGRTKKKDYIFSHFYYKTQKIPASARLCLHILVGTTDRFRFCPLRLEKRITRSAAPLALLSNMNALLLFSWLAGTRTESSVPCASSLLPAQSAWSSWWEPKSKTLQECKTALTSQYQTIFVVVGFLSFCLLKPSELTWFFHLQTVHSILSTSFFVVLAFFLRIGFDWPPKPCCLRSYLGYLIFEKLLANKDVWVGAEAGQMDILVDKSTFRQ